MCRFGAFIIRVDQSGAAGVFDARSKMRIDVVNVTRTLKVRGGQINILDAVSFSVQPNEFVGVLGPSGSWKVIADRSHEWSSAS
jgi:ABC-type protease/lipase transport system fused ATPase/permease subunit